MTSCSRYNLAPNNVLRNTYTQVKVTKKNRNLVTKKFVLSVTHGMERVNIHFVNIPITF